MKRKILLSALLYSAMFGICQAQIVPDATEEVVTSTDVQPFNQNVSTFIDPNGNIYNAGGTTNGGGFLDLAISKIIPDGTIEWSKNYAGVWGGNSFFSKVIYDGNSSTVIAVGTRYSGSSDKNDIAIYVHDNYGNYINHKIINSNHSLDDGAMDVVVDENGNYYLCGISDNSNGSDIIIIKLDANLAIEWDIYANFNGMLDGAHHIVYNIDEQTVTIGGGTQTSLNTYRYLTLTYDLNGNLVEDHFSNYNHTFIDRITAIAKDNAGNIYACGASFDGSKFSAHTIKLDTLLNVEWETFHNASPAINDFNTCLAVDGSGNVYTGGFYNTTME
nr:hypothetical protein [Bacteroidota bacterium]